MMKFRLWWSWFFFVVAALTSSQTFGNIFDQDDEILEGSEGDHPDHIEDTEQAIEDDDFRSAKSVSLAGTLGETLPGMTYGLLALYHLSETSSLRWSLATGRRKFSNQSNEDAAGSRTSTGMFMDLGYEFWPQVKFPFLLSLGASFGRVTGQTSRVSPGDDSYRFHVLSVGPELVLENYFESGLWIRWVLVAVRYGKVLPGGQFGILSERIENLVKNDYQGTKMVGFANVGLGYSW